MSRAKTAIPETIVPFGAHQRLAAERKALAVFTNVDFQRARFWCLSSSVAVSYPRRLGPDATPQELTVDKRISRRMCNLYRELWRLMNIRETGVPVPPLWRDWPISTIDPMMNRVGSTVRWESQIDYLANVATNRLQLLSGYEELAIRDGLTKWHYKHSELLEWERRKLLKVKDFVEAKRPTG